MITFTTTAADYLMAGRCPANDSRNSRLHRCGRKALPALTVCARHIDKHEHWLPQFVALWFARFGAMRP